MGTNADFTSAEKLRYARHFTLPELGPQGQSRLRRSRVLCIGAGGLGSPAAIYLAAAGLGHIGIVDPDVVDASNLHRQILHGESDIDRKKTDSAREHLAEINPHVQIETHEAALTSGNAREIAEGYDLILDGTDNFATRYLSNDLAFFLGIPNVYGSIFRFEGQVSVFAPHLGGPCYRCMFPQPPEPGLVPSCAEGGVLGVLPGIVGTLQANEAIKMLAGIGDSLCGRLLHFDALAMKFREIKLRRDPQCPLCGKNPEITDLIDYDAFCGLPVRKNKEAVTDENTEIDPMTLSGLMKNGAVLIDVREPYEREICVIPDSNNIPLDQLPGRLGEVPIDQPVIFYCQSGMRSEKAVSILRESGHKQVSHLEGGILAWLADVGE